MKSFRKDDIVIVTRLGVSRNGEITHYHNIGAKVRITWIASGYCEVYDAKRDKSQSVSNACLRSIGPIISPNIRIL